MAASTVACQIVIEEHEQPVMVEHFDAWKYIIEEYITSKEESLHELSRFLWNNPETTYNETKAQQFLCDFLEREGFSVEKGFVVATGFRAIFQSPASEVTSQFHFLNLDGGGDVEQPNVCFLCEYDSTAEVGHAAGHNLKTQSSIAAALSIKECLDKHMFKGKVTLIGTPGEDCGCGVKIKLINEGIFADIDFCLMLSPFNKNILLPKFYTLLTVTVSYKGKAAHASTFPWEGHNALDAAVACYNNISLLRQQLKPSWSINGILLSGGVQPNVIPEHSQLKFWLRVPSHMDLVFFQQKCTACFVAAAKATGCEVDIHFEDPPYYPMSHNKKLADIYRKAALAHDMIFCEDEHIIDKHIGSTDLGNVSQIVPCILPAFDIGKKSHIYSTGFHEASGSEEAFQSSLNAAKVLALTAAEVLASPAALQSMMAEHYQYFGQRTPILVERVRARAHVKPTVSEVFENGGLHTPALLPVAHFKAATSAVPHPGQYSGLYTPALQNTRMVRYQATTPALLRPVSMNTHLCTPALQHIKIVRSQATTPGLIQPASSDDSDKSKKLTSVVHKIQIVRAQAVTPETPSTSCAQSKSHGQPTLALQHIPIVRSHTITPGLFHPAPCERLEEEGPCTPAFPHLKRALSLGTD